MTVWCNDPQHEARRARERAEGITLHGEWWSPRDLETGKPCIICGAPVDRFGNGHDRDCMGLDG